MKVTLANKCVIDVTDCKYERVQKYLKILPQMKGVRCVSLYDIESDDEELSAVFVYEVTRSEFENELERIRALIPEASSDTWASMPAYGNEDEDTKVSTKTLGAVIYDSSW